MLKLFRGSKIVVKILLWGIVGMLGFAMVVTLVPGMSGDISLTDPQGNLARVGDATVTQFEVNRRVSQQMRQFGDNPLFRQFVTQQVVQDLINRRAAVHEARRLGLQVSQAELSAELQANLFLYPDGKFIGAEAYRTFILQQFSMAPAEFERNFREDILLRKLRMWVTGGITVTKAELEQEFRRRNDKVRLEYVLFRPSDRTRRVEVTEDDLRAYFDSHQDRYQLPERRSVRYVDIDTATLRRRIQVSDSELRALYRSRRSEYRVPEAMRVRHIHFPAPAPSSEEAEAAGSGNTQREEVRKNAEAVLAQLAAGGDFAKLAEEHSSDLDSKVRGGEIGWIERGQTVPALEQKLFALAPGTPAELVEVSYGFHIVQVLEQRDDHIRPLEDVQGELESFLKQQTVEREAVEQARQIAQAVRSGKSLDEAAQAAGWTVSELPPITRDQALPLFGEGRQFQDIAFGLPEGTVSEPVALPAGYAVLQVKEISPARPAEYNDVRVQILQQYQQEKAGEQAEQAAYKLAERARKGNLAAAARRAGLKLETSEWVARDGSIPNLGQVRSITPSVFSLSVGEVSAAIQVASNWVVLRLAEHQEPDLAGLEAERGTLLSGLTVKKRNLYWAAFQEEVRRKLEDEGVIKINASALSRLLGRR